MPPTTTVDRSIVSSSPVSWRHAVTRATTGNNNGHNNELPDDGLTRIDGETETAATTTMANENNNALSNGSLPHRSEQRLGNERGSDRAKRVPDIPATESLDWLLHRYYTRHEYKISRTLIERDLARSNGHNEYANYFKGLVLRKEGKIQDSLDSFKMCYNVNSTNANSVKQIGKSLFLLASHKRAVEAYTEAGRMTDHPDWEIHYNLGECYVRLCQPEDAESELKKAIELTNDESPYLALARLYAAKDRVDDAIRVYSKAFEVSKESEEAATELGLLYLRAGETRCAFQQFGTVLANSPCASKALLPMAYIIQSHREYDVALSKYKMAVESTPESSYLWNNIGMCFYGKDKLVAAISCLKRAHYLNPTGLGPACNLGRVLLTTGQPASAAIYLCAAITAGPNDSLPYLLLGHALNRLDDPEGAEKAISKAHDLAPQDPLVLVNYATILEVTGQKERASEILVALDDVVAVTDVEPRIIRTAQNLATKIGRRQNENCTN